MRGMVWNSKKYELNVRKKVKKAIEKGFLITNHKEENSKHFFFKVNNITNKRHTKGYYYELTIQLYSIIQKFEIFADKETIDDVKASMLKNLKKEMEEP